MKSPAFSLDYFASQEAAWSLYRPLVSIPPTSGNSQTPLGTYGSTGSSNGPWSSDHLSSDPNFPYSTGNTPPKLSRSNTVKSTTTQSASSSPEYTYRNARTSGSSLANAFAGTLSRPFASFSSSSPPTHGKSPDNAQAELSTSAPTNGGVTWGVNTIYGPDTSGAQSPRSHRLSTVSEGYHVENEPSNYSQSHYTTDSEYDMTDGFAMPTARVSFPYMEIEPEVKVSLKNQDRFDDEACVSIPLLEPNITWKHRAYRNAYANLLFAWNLWLFRCEIQRFNGLPSYWMNDESEEHVPPKNTHNGPVFKTKNIFRQGKELQESDATGLEVGIRCIYCGRTHFKRECRGAQIDPGENNKCDHCTKATKAIACSICWCPISGLFKFCANCGHISHASCAAEWFNSETRNSRQLCESGCGCDCASHALSIDNVAALDTNYENGFGDSRASDIPETASGRPKERRLKDAARKGGARLAQSVKQALISDKRPRTEVYE
jgi:hypothetical protein